MAIPELAVVPPSLVGSVKFDLMLHLLHLKGHHRVIDVALAMVLAEDRLGIFDFALCHEPSWGLWKHPHASSYNNRRYQLTPDRDTEA